MRRCSRSAAATSPTIGSTSMTSGERMRELAFACAVLGCMLTLGGRPLPCAAAEAATESTAFEQLLQRLSARRHGHVAFTEVQQLSILDRPVHSSGELLYD